jgi:hypothetical protein
MVGSLNKKQFLACSDLPQDKGNSGRFPVINGTGPRDNRGKALRNQFK